MRTHRSHLALAVAAAVGIGAVATTSASAGLLAQRTCHGLPVTVTASKGEVQGTSRADVIALTGAARVDAGAGNDIICGSPKADVIDAGRGNDVVVGGAGADRLVGGAGRDRLYGDRGGDHLVGGPGADFLMGGRGRDTVVRGAEGSRGHNEQQVGDVVAPDTRSISLVVDMQTLQTMYMANMSFGTVMGSATAPGTLPVVWSGFQPLQSNMIGLDGQLAAYASASPELMPGITIQPTTTVNASPGQMFNLVSTAPPQLQAAGAGAPNVVGVTNTTANPALVGLARSAWVNGQSGSPSPITASTAWGYMVAQMQVPTQATLFVTSQPLMPGQVMSSLTAGPNVLAVRRTPGTDTATASFNINTGFSQG